MDTRVADLARRLGETGYLCDDDLATVLFLSLEMGRPLLLEGEPGTGKTALAEAVAVALDRPLIRLQCYEGIDATQALYDWDFPRQILHLRALEALSGGERGDLAEAEKSLYDERFLLARPVLAALQQSPVVLLIDEVDRADDEFEAFLLEVLSTFQVTIPELGTIQASTPPTVVLTSNRTREPARRAQAALPLPLDRPPGPGPRDRRGPLPGARGQRGARPPGRGRRPAGCAPATTCSSRRASRRPWTGRAPCSTSAPSSPRWRPRRARSARW
ncbi:AAA family ATPase [Nocardioides convexus]|uniref:AAA family ATPase n=1 Tax=Nocardioides convexus TaxID=2712224 RepID=UPI002418A965|nr:AAA family ATPase [Nocardioides convexus]